ncbi:helix-turn-helix transcriptional regulator [Nonomuraea roseoviolacea]|uniref:DNA-binding CsgD family transcriptional regulator n=1 Tax=Nonomuraea roseoviolacea subsp. carminata TaxID=160689 RepID=A0ABT1K4K8_9ACTN|nr:LuxR family transcriptional regulator [Nonomuraea roseoviolacea]MCP2348945.1 DNA-binding CsgD family transcriptional regulator [Nonomuraea roseoviolacea subsp. carminata]
MAVDDERRAMSLLHGLLEEAVAGRGRIAVVTGAIATGKSRLLYGFADEAFEHGALPLSAMGSRAERDLPLGVLAQLLHNAPMTEEHRATTLALLHEGARTHLASDPRADAIEHVDVQIVDALCTVLLELAERCPLVVAVDDMHHADRASQLCLAYLARRVKYARIMLVFGTPGHQGHPPSLLHTEVLRQPHCRQVRLGHLSREGVAERVTLLAGEEAAARYAPRCHEVSGGNRILVDAALEDLQESGAPGERYGEAVVACLHRAGPEALLMARALAVAGTTSAAARLLGRTGADDGEPGRPHGSRPHAPGQDRPCAQADAARAEQALTGAGLLDGGRFRHEAARGAVLAGLDGAERARLHRGAAELAYHDGAPVAVVAEHLLRAGHAGAPWALPVLEEAAEQALRDGDVEPAIEYLKLAWQACADERRRARITTTLVRAKWRINPSTPAGHLAELTTALRNGNLGGGDAVVLAKALLWHGHDADAKDVLARLAELGEPDRETVAELAAARAWFRSSYPSFLSHLPVLSEEQASGAAHSLTVGRRLESAGALARALAGECPAEPAATAERVLRGCRLDEMSMDTVESALLTLTYTGRADRAAPWCDAFIAEAASRHAPSRQARLSAIRAEIHLRRGDLAGAVDDARRALEIIPPASWGVAVGGPLGSLLLAGAAMGRFEEFLPYADRPVPEAMLETRFGLHYLYGRGRFHLLAGQPRQALRDLRLCGELMRAWGLDAPGFIAWRLDVAEALVRLEEPEEARLLVEDQLARCDRRAPRVHGAGLRLLAATGEPRHRVMVLRQSAELLQSSGDRYELARTLGDLTEAYRAMGEFRRAWMVGRRARALAEECHVTVLDPDLAPGEDGDGGEAEPAGLRPVLSDAERRVAALAADGYSNREISGKLFITVSTVEQHLTRIYRKLNVTRRTELPADLMSRQA